jgi:hypothetical protein
MVSYSTTLSDRELAAALDWWSHSWRVRLEPIVLRRRPDREHTVLAEGFDVAGIEAGACLWAIIDTETRLNLPFLFITLSRVHSDRALLHSRWRRGSPGTITELQPDGKGRGIWRSATPSKAFQCQAFRHAPYFRSSMVKMAFITHSISY